MHCVSVAPECYLCRYLHVQLATTLHDNPCSSLPSVGGKLEPAWLYNNIICTYLPVIAAGHAILMTHVAYV